MIGWIVAIAVIVVLGVIAFWIWRVYSDVSITNSTRRKQRAEAEIAEQEIGQGARFKQQIDLNNISEKSSSKSSQTKTQELKDIAQLYKDELIDKDEYEKLKREILDRD